MSNLPAIETDRDLLRILKVSGVQYPASPKSWPEEVKSVKGYPGEEMVHYLVKKAAEMGLLVWIPAAWVEDVQRSMVRELLGIVRS